jgi:lipoprotein-anchoring transpeptidase ErfK/SrfK
VTLRIVSIVSALSLALACLAGTPTKSAPGVTFTTTPGSLFVSAREVATDLKVALVYDARSDLAFLGSIPLDYRTSVGDQRFVDVNALRSLGAKIKPGKNGTMRIALNGRDMSVKVGKKSAIVDKTRQQIRMYQGGSLVLTSRISTGKFSRSTPDGVFRVGNTKDAYKSSDKYDDAPMPWAVHVTGNIFIHGGEVANHPASHGCVRLPVDAAQWFYNWVEPGTVVTIRG